MTQNRRPVRPGASPSRSPGQPVRQVSGASRRRTRLPYDFWPLVAACCALLVVCGLLQVLMPTMFSQQGGTQAVAVVAEVHSAGPIRINELMSSNSATLVDENGLTADWLEIANVGNTSVNLEGYMLAKDENATNVFVFPEHVLEAGACVVVYADNTLQAQSGAPYHAPFKLSSRGGTLMLFSPTGTAIDSVNFPSMSSDAVYVRQDANTWRIDTQPTPGLPNTDESYQALHQVVTGAGVEITEIVSSNTSYAPDANGAYHDYFELHNTTSSTIDLSGWFVSDNDGQPIQWRLPDGLTLGAGEYKIIYASGLDRAEPDEPHTNFGLSSEGEVLILADPQGRVVDRVVFDLLKTDQAWLKRDDGSWSTGTPSPGEPNA